MAAKSLVATEMRNYRDISSAERIIKDPDTTRSVLAMTIAHNGSVLLVDNNHREVCVFNRNGKLVKTFPVEGCEQIEDITELTNSNIALSDMTDGRIVIYTPEGEFAGEFDANTPKHPCGLATSKEGKVFVVSFNEPRLWVFNENGTFQYSFDCTGPHIGDALHLLCICIDNKGLVYVTDHRSKRVLVFQQDGTFVHHFDCNSLLRLRGIAATKDDHIVVTSVAGDKVSIFTSSGVCIHELKGGELHAPKCVAVDDCNCIYVSNVGNDNVLVF